MDYEPEIWSDEPSPIASKEEHWPCVYLDVPKGMSLKGLEVGEEVTILLKGKIKGLSDREYGKSMDVELRSLNVKENTSNEFEEMAASDE